MKDQPKSHMTDWVNGTGEGPLVDDQPNEVTEALEVLRKHPQDFRILERFLPASGYHVPGAGDLYRGLYVDCETTGGDTARDEIWELAIAEFWYDPILGKVVRCNKSWQWLGEPKGPWNEKARSMAAAGIDLETLKGKEIPWREVREVCNGASLIVAHNAFFDRRMCERNEGTGTFEVYPWGCSQQDVPWREQFGALSERLEVLVLTQLGLFYAAHRALVDCQVGIHLLTTSVDKTGRTALSHLLENVSAERIRIWAVGARYEYKDMLRERGYRWNDGKDGRPKAWHTSISPDRLEEENVWLRKNTYAYPTTTTTTAFDRYSNREG